MKQIEGDNICAMEVGSALNILMESLEERKNSKFLSTAVKNEITKVAVELTNDVMKERVCERDAVCETDAVRGVYLNLIYFCEIEFKLIFVLLYRKIEWLYQRLDSHISLD